MTAANNRPPSSTQRGLIWPVAAEDEFLSRQQARLVGQQMPVGIRRLGTVQIIGDDQVQRELTATNAIKRQTSSSVTASGRPGPGPQRGISASRWRSVDPSR